MDVDYTTHSARVLSCINTAVDSNRNVTLKGALTPKCVSARFRIHSASSEFIHVSDSALNYGPHPSEQILVEKYYVILVSTICPRLRQNPS